MASIEKSARVVVGCKMPRGIQLRTFHFQSMTEAVVGGGVRDFKQAVQDKDIFIIKGNSYPFGILPDHPIIDGTALTLDVPGDLWRKFAEQNKDADFIVNDLLWAEPDESSARAHAKNNRKEISGLEPMRQEKDPRAPRQIEKGTTKEAA